MITFHMDVELISGEVKDNVFAVLFLSLDVCASCGSVVP